MLALARERLDTLASVELLEGDFLELDIRGEFDVVLALGLFDYLDEPARAAEWMRVHCSSILVASFTRRDWVKGRFAASVTNGSIDARSSTTRKLRRSTANRRRVLGR